jgi:hypothetical protein
MALPRAVIGVAFTKEDSAETASETLLLDRPISPLSEPSEPWGGRSGPQGRFYFLRISGGEASGGQNLLGM